MPNICENKMLIEFKSPHGVDAFMSRRESETFFRDIVPSPYEQGQSFMTNEERDWNVENWGTKWDIPFPDDYAVFHTAVELRFETAWTPPNHNLLKAICKQFDVESVSLFYYEAGMCFAGQDAVYSESGIIESQFYEAETATQFAKEIGLLYFMDDE